MKSTSKRSRALLGVLGPALALLTLNACIAKSIAPVIGEADREFDARLVGDWQIVGDDESATVTAHDADYRIVYRQDDEVIRLHGRLGRLGGTRILDVSPDDSDWGDGDVREAMYLPMHLPLNVDFVGQNIRLRVLSDDSLKAYLRRDPAATPHTEIEDHQFLLTASTAELRGFLERHLRRPGVWEEWSVWQRR